MNVGDVLNANVIRFPEKVAVVADDRKVTYRELNGAVNQLAHGLLKLGIKKRTKATIFLPNCLEWPEIYFALSKIGAVIVPVNYRLVGDELVYIINHSDSEMIFFSETHFKVFEQVRHNLKNVKHFVFLEDNPPRWCIPYHSLKEGFSSQEPPCSLGDEDAHTISYTSGTTGLPKGAVLTHLNVIIGHCFMTTAEFGVTHEDVFFATTPLCQRIGWGKLVNSIAMGCKLVIMPSFDPAKALELVQREQVTIMSIIPTIARMLLQLPNIERYDVSSLRMFLVTGEMFPMETKRSLMETFPHVQLAPHYAQTEAGLVTKLFSKDIFKKAGSVGVPFLGVEVKIVDEHMQDVPVGQSGEIIVRSSRLGTFGVMKEYYKDSVANQENFWGDWIRTGDIGSIDENGYLYIFDRKRDMIISGGFNIYSKEVESVLESHPKISEAAVVGIPNAEYGEAVKAFIVLVKGQETTQEEIIEFCKSKMAGYKKPKEIEFVNSLPRNTVGKVLKYKLKEKGNKS
jgi:long-chain acyl-CoA synthetase